MQAMSADAGTSLQQVQTLAEQSREIGKVLDVIRHRRADQPARAQCRDRPGKLNR